MGHTFKGNRDLLLFLLPGREVSDRSVIPYLLGISASAQAKDQESVINSWTLGGGEQMGVQSNYPLSHQVWIRTALLLALYEGK
jgi:hypothetical protein